MLDCPDGRHGNEERLGVSMVCMQVHKHTCIYIHTLNAAHITCTQARCEHACASTTKCEFFCWECFVFFMPTAFACTRVIYFFLPEPSWQCRREWALEVNFWVFVYCWSRCRSNFCLSLWQRILRLAPRARARSGGCWCTCCISPRCHSRPRALPKENRARVKRDLK